MNTLGNFCEKLAKITDPTQLVSSGLEVNAQQKHPGICRGVFVSVA